MKKSIIILIAVLWITAKSNALKKDYPTTAFTQEVFKNKLVEFASFNKGDSNFVYAAEKTIHAVVHVKTVQDKPIYTNDPFYDFFWGKPQIPKNSSTGSGVIISPEGYIVTNNHVVEDASEIEITLNDKRRFNAKIIGTDPTTDIAVLKIEATNLPYIIYGNSDEVKIGEWVLAVGNPFNLTSTVTAGIVSAKGRNINILGGGNAIESYIQTDAAVNPGNSGGALVSTEGLLIGINSAIASNTGSYTGYSFAIPSNIVSKVVTDIIQYGQVQRAYLGVNIKEIDANLAKEKGIEEMTGVYIASVIENGAAEKAGLEVGDIIIDVNNVIVNSPSELQEQIGRHRPGESVIISIKRNNKIKKQKIILEDINGGTKIAVIKNTTINKLLGVELKELNNQEKTHLNIKNGVKITEIKDGLLKTAGIKNGFIITRIDNKTINNINDINEILKSKSGGILIEGIYPNGLRAYYGIGIN